jgi:hypothetical protein
MYSVAGPRMRRERCNEVVDRQIADLHAFRPLLGVPGRLREGIARQAVGADQRVLAFEWIAYPIWIDRFGTLRHAPDERFPITPHWQTTLVDPRIALNQGILCQNSRRSRAFQWGLLR